MKGGGGRCPGVYGKGIPIDQPIVFEPPGSGKRIPIVSRRSNEKALLLSLHSGGRIIRKTSVARLVMRRTPHGSTG